MTPVAKGVERPQPALRVNNTSNYDRTGGYRFVHFGKEGTRVVLRFNDREQNQYFARVYDLATGQPLTPPLPHEGTVLHASLSPDGQRVVTAGDDKTARLWDAEPGKELKRITITPPAAAPPPAAGGFVPLFNGKDRTGWSVEGGITEQWTVEGGTLVGRSHDRSTHNYLLTDKEYANFALRFDFHASFVSASATAGRRAQVVRRSVFRSPLRVPERALDAAWADTAPDYRAKCRTKPLPSFSKGHAK